MSTDANAVSAFREFFADDEQHLKYKTIAEFFGMSLRELEVCVGLSANSFGNRPHTKGTQSKLATAFRLVCIATDICGDTQSASNYVRMIPLKELGYKTCCEVLLEGNIDEVTKVLIAKAS